METFILLIISWLIAGLIGSGYFFASIQGEFPGRAKEHFREDLGSALLFTILGPIGAVVGFFLSGFGKLGWRLWAKKTEKGR